MPRLAIFLFLTCFSLVVHASPEAGPQIDLTSHTIGYIALVVFSLAYLLVMAEEFTDLRKSKPVIVAAGVALMGQARGKYTFFGHLKWAPVIALSYAASIATHMWINSAAFLVPITQ